MNRSTSDKAAVVAAASRESASDALVRLATILRTTTHDPSSAAWKLQLRGLTTALGPTLVAEKTARLVLREGVFHMNDVPVRVAYYDYTTVKGLSDELHKFRIGGIELTGIPDEGDLEKLVTLFSRHTQNLTPNMRFLAEDLAKEGVRKVVLLPEVAGSAGAIKDPRVAGVFTFLKGIAAVQEVMDALRTGKSVGFKHAKRFVQDAVDLVHVDPSLLLALTSIKNYQDYLFNHSVNVCLTSVVVGARLGFSKNKLADLGLAALLRDVGKATIPKAILEKQGPLTPDEWRQLQSFPFAAVAGLLRFGGFNDSLMRQVVVAFEHKFRSTNDDHFSARDFCLFSRIAQLADAFDAMTTPRPYRPKPITPDDALRQIIVDRHLTRADPALIKLFINSIGLYPVGTVVVLDTREIAVVAAPPASLATIARPKVRLVADPYGNEMLSAPIADLAEMDPATGRYTRTINGTIDRWNYGISVARHLLSDDAAPQLVF